MEDRARVIVFVFAAAVLCAVPGVRAEQATPPPASPQGATEIRDQLQQLRQEFDLLRQDYEKRMTALETRLNALEQPKAGAAPSPTGEATVATVTGQQSPQTTVPAGASGAGGPEGALPVYSNPAASSKVFNPDIAVIGNFLGAAGSNSIDQRPPLALDEAEVGFQAIVDPYARADFFLTGSSEGVGVEEGYLTLTALPGGFLVKVGKMKANFGKTNTLHPHQLPWVDQPLVVNNILGSFDGLNDSGFSVSKLIINPWFFLEATGEVFSGNNDTFKSYQRSDLSYVGRLHGYRDISEGSNIDLGASFGYGHNELADTGQTHLYGIDATFRYRPLRRAIYHRLLARTELMWNQSNAASGDPFATSFGMYAGGEYQFARRWFAGARYDWSARRFQPALHDSGGSALMTYWPSEFSQIRGQYRRRRYAEGVTANEFLFQFQFSIGAHGAHTF